MTDTLNTLACFLTLAFGAFGFVMPRYTASALDLETTHSTMGLSEMRASVGGLFVLGALGAWWLNDAMAFVMLGICYAGAALGRAVSLLIDHPPVRKVLIFGGIETALAAWLILANI